MIEIYIDNTLIEMDNESIVLQKEFSDEIQNIVTDVEFSYTVEIPSTLNNDKVFNFASTFDVGNKFSRVYDCDLYADNTLLLSGKFKLSSIEDGYYKGNIYNPKRKSISDILGDKKLNEIKSHLKPLNNLKDIKRLNRYVGHIGSGWDTVLSNNYEHLEDVEDNHVCFPYVLYGLPLNKASEVPADTDIYTQYTAFQYNNIGADIIFPAFNVVSVLKDIFKTEGYNLVGNVIDNNAYFNDLYQTFQGNYSDYNDERLAPMHCKFGYKYSNYNKYLWTPSNTMETVTLWNQSEFDSAWGDNPHFGGNMYYGADSPSMNNNMNEYSIQNYGSIKRDSIEDDCGMFQYSLDRETYGQHIVVIPKSGWYRIKVDGNMKYPYPNFKKPLIGNWDNAVGGYLDEGDNTSLAELPFEFQIKKGTPMSNPKLYSFNSIIPMQPADFVEEQKVLLSCENTYLKYDSKANRYGKNGKAVYVRDYSDFSTSDFLCGARLGGAWFSSDWGPGGAGHFRRENRQNSKGSCLALPRTTNTTAYSISRVCQYKEGQNTNVDPDNVYIQLGNENTNKTYEYAEDTAQVLVRPDSYSNFDGYNQLNYNEVTSSLTWDTTSNYGAISYQGLTDCSAATTSVSEGSWHIDTVVWLEEGDTVYEEILMPYHEYSEWQHHTMFRSSKWKNRQTWINITDVDYDIEIGLVSNKKDWKPSVNSPVPSWDTIDDIKYTNVNQFLPQTKCNDYLNNFLKTFNLQLTMLNDKTFSIDTTAESKLRTNIISIDNIVNINDASFKPLQDDKVRMLTWKNDLSETGYLDGNRSPYKQFDPQYKLSNGQYPLYTVDIPWFESGYTGSITIPNDSSTTKNVEKTESQWSYAWYKTIKFIDTYDNHYESVMVVSDASLWKDGMTFVVADGEKPQTSKTSRLFFLNRTKTGVANNVYFDVMEFNPTTAVGTNIDDYDTCLLLPANYLESNEGTEGGTRQELDYGVMPKHIVSYTYGSTHNEVSITDKFFNYGQNDAYQIDVPIRLSNQDYADIKHSTLIKFNDGLYRVQKIEGHDVNGNDEATLSLLTL